MKNKPEKKLIIFVSIENVINTVRKVKKNLFIFEKNSTIYQHLHQFFRWDPIVKLHVTPRLFVNLEKNFNEPHRTATVKINLLVISVLI